MIKALVAAVCSFAVFPVFAHSRVGNAEYNQVSSILVKERAANCPAEQMALVSSGVGCIIPEQLAIKISIIVAHDMRVVILPITSKLTERNEINAISYLPRFNYADERLHLTLGGFKVRNNSFFFSIHINLI